jgi:hypothetical protein
MSWSDLSLTSDWSNFATYPNARVRPLSGITGAAELEGYLIFSGSGVDNVAITSSALPSGTFDTSSNHTIVGRWYNSSGSHVGTSELFINDTGIVSVLVVPSGGYSLWFGDVYPTA